MSSLRDQYLKAHDLFDSENSRFWTRFNLFTGLQLIVVAGLASNYQDLVKLRLVAFLFVVAAFAFSVFTILVMWRSHQISMGIFKTICELEEKDDSLILLQTYLQHSKSPMGSISRYCVVMSSLLALFWIFFLIIVITQ